MTYCIGIKTNEGVVLASDSRTNAGLDNVNIYSKMLTYDVGDRTVVIVLQETWQHRKQFLSLLRKT